MLKKFNNPKYTQIGTYVVIVATIIIAINAFIDNVPYFFQMVWDKVVWIGHNSKPILVAIAFAYLLAPLVDTFEGLLLKLKSKIKFLRKRKGSARPLAVAIVMIILIGAIVGLISILVFSITDNVKIASFDDLFVIVNKYKDMVNDLYDRIMKVLAKANIESAGIESYIRETALFIVDVLSDGASKTIKYISNISGFIANMVISCVITVYLLLDGKRVIRYAGKVCRAFMSKKNNDRIKSFVNDVDTVFSGYIRGQFADAFVVMVLVGIGLSVIGVEFAILIAILTGIGNLIPYVGPIVAYGGVILSSILSGDMKTFIIAMIFLLIIQTIDGNVIGPKLLSNSVEVHPMLVIIFILFGSAMGGLLGMLFAVPVGALIKVLFVRLVDKKLLDKGLDGKTKVIAESDK